MLITGASRGIGAATARLFARTHGASLRIALLGRSKDGPSHVALSGTLLETARDVEEHDGAAFPVAVDMSDGSALVAAVEQAVHTLGGLDVLVNNASVLATTPTLSPKRMDLMHAVNTRGTLLCIQTCAEALAESRGAIVTMAPPIRLGRTEWVAAHPAYTISKYGMTLATLGAASARVRANCLWPRRTVATAATRLLEDTGVLPGAFSRGRSEDFVARAVHAVAVERTCNAETLLDEDVLDPDDGGDAPVDAFVDAGWISEKNRARLMRHC